MRIRTGALLSLLVLVGQVAVAESPRASRPERGESGGRPDSASKPAPTIPVILDGVEYPAGKLPMTREARYYVQTEEDQKKGVMHAFSSSERMAAFMRLEEKKTGGKGPNGEVLEAYPNCGWMYAYSTFNKNRGGGGTDEIVMFKEPRPYIGERYTNLDFDGWNNTISHVRAACVGYWTALYSCRDFQLSYDPFFCQDPDVLFIPSGAVYPDLMQHGFNNRTSSIRFCLYDRDDSDIPCIEN